VRSVATDSFSGGGLGTLLSESRSVEPWSETSLTLDGEILGPKSGGRPGSADIGVFRTSFAAGSGAAGSDATDSEDSDEPGSEGDEGGSESAELCRLKLAGAGAEESCEFDNHYRVDARCDETALQPDEGFQLSERNNYALNLRVTNRGKTKAGEAERTKDLLAAGLRAKNYDLRGGLEDRFADVTVSMRRVKKGGFLFWKKHYCEVTAEIFSPLHAELNGTWKFREKSCMKAGEKVLQLLPQRERGR
jgi:hypothetical protein